MKTVMRQTINDRQTQVLLSGLREELGFFMEYM